MKGLRIQRFCNPKGIVSSSPGLRGTSYPGSRRDRFSTPTGLCHVATEGPQPRWGCWVAAWFPRVARASQPWAWSRNPFGIQLWNSRKALGLDLVSSMKDHSEEFCLRPKSLTDTPRLRVPAF